MNVGERIKTRRLELGLTLEDVGKFVGVGKSTVRKWETGMIRNMGRDKISLLAKILEIPPTDFINIEDHSIVDSLTDAEINLIKKYRLIDERGRTNINRILEAEYEAQKEKVPAVRCEDFP